MNTTMKKEELEKSLDRVNHWIIAVDQKISIAIAVIVGSLANSKNSTYEIDLIEQIHTNSIIAKKKYSHYKDALLVILVAIFLWLLLITLITLEVLSDKT
jgi:hypothetical protein